jgi:hypothetical protein
MKEVFVLYSESSRMHVGKFATRELAYEALEWFLRNSSGDKYFILKKSEGV